MYVVRTQMSFFLFKIQSRKGKVGESRGASELPAGGLPPPPPPITNSGASEKIKKGLNLLQNAIN